MVSMTKSTTVLTQKKRGPAPTGKGVLVGVRLQPAMLTAVDKFVDEQAGISRPEAIRLILRDWLIGNGMMEQSDE